jgi:2-dehydropantoate 2-reductase
MKICIFGAGAIGGAVAAYMGRAGLDVTLFARGATLAAVRDKGLILRTADDEIVTRPNVTDDAEEAGIHDVIITTLKVPAVRGALSSIKPLIGPETVVIPAHNGVPWWYFHALPGDWQKQHLDSVDPGGNVWEGLGPERTIGCVVYMGASVPEPGVISHLGRADRLGRFPVGELDGAESERVQRVSEAFKTAGFESPVSTEIRTEVWFKILGNIGANPISVLTQGTMGKMYADDGVSELVVGMMYECYAITEKLGITLPSTPEERVEGYKQPSDFRTSMLQDFDKGRPIEIDAIVGAVAEIGRMVNVETPFIDAVYALTRLRAETAGSYQAP